MVKRLVPVELGLDAIRLGMLPEFAAPACVITFADELEQKLAVLRLPRRMGRAVWLEPLGIPGHAGTLPDGPDSQVTSSVTPRVCAQSVAAGSRGRRVVVRNSSRPAAL